MTDDWEFSSSVRDFLVIQCEPKLPFLNLFTFNYLFIYK